MQKVMATAVVVTAVMATAVVVTAVMATAVRMLLKSMAGTVADTPGQQKADWLICFIRCGVTNEFDSNY
jgi:hypothetical protein